MILGMAIDSNAQEYTFKISNDTLTISFQANPTTGYGWSFSCDKEGVIEKVSDQVIAPEAAEGEEEALGKSGQHEFVFKAKEKGKITATFGYARPWERNKPAKQLSFLIKVNSGKNISIKEK